MSEEIESSNTSFFTMQATGESERICSRVYEYLLDSPYKFSTPPVNHFLHGGIYTRTLFLPKGILAVGARIKVPTTVILHGDVLLSNGINVVRSTGFSTFKGVPNRRCIAYALENTYFTTHNVSKAKTLEEAEKEFTDEWQLLSTYNNEEKEEVNKT